MVKTKDALGITIEVEPERELARLVARADVLPVVLEKEGVRYRLTREEPDPFADYDPVQVQASFRSLVGIFDGVDTEALKAELREQRRVTCPPRLSLDHPEQESLQRLTALPCPLRKSVPHLSRYVPDL